MKPASFTLVPVRTADEAVSQLAEYGDDARLLAGGQSLVPMMNFRLARPAVLLDLNDCVELDYIRVEGDALAIGAMTRQYRAQTDAQVLRLAPVAAAALTRAGPRTIRNRGTVGGSMVNGYATAQLLSVASCLDASMVLLSSAGERIAPAEEFFLGGLSTDLATGELLREVRLPARREGERQAFRQAAAHASGPAVVCLSGAGTPQRDGCVAQARLAVIGIDAVPRRLRAVEELLAAAHSPAQREEALAADVAGCQPEPGDEAMQGLRLTFTRSLLQEVVADLACGGMLH